MSLAQTKVDRYHSLYTRLLAIREEMAHLGWSGDQAPLMAEAVALEGPLASLHKKRDEQIVKAWEEEQRRMPVKG